VLKLMLMMAAFITAIWFHVGGEREGETILPGQERIIAADGDSFSIGARKFRLKGIDAPEYRQTCMNAAGVSWPCGDAARQSMAALLGQPGLSCHSGAHDRYGRALVTCAAGSVPDIAAAQVRAGMAISSASNTRRSYPREEDEARAAKRGIWQGSFMAPKEWRAAHVRGSKD
jgi:endonuclease YncB( thermonuclease family)